MGRIITLTSDLKSQDHYVAAVKGVIYSDLPECRIVDVSHEINPFDIIQASFVLKGCYKEYPKGTIHIIGVDSSDAEKVQAIVIENEGQYFIGADNGVFSLLFEGEYDKIYKVVMPDDNSGAYTFLMKEVYAKLAIFIAKGGSLEDICTEVDHIEERLTIQATGNGDMIQGYVMYIDAYRNAVINISLDLFTEIGNGRPFKIHFRPRESIDYICSDYNDVGVGEVVCIFGSLGYLELAINKDKAVDLIGIQVGAPIQIEFI